MNFEKLYIGGQWASSSSGDWIQVENPATREKFARVPAGNSQDIDAAVQAARSAFPGWASTPLKERVEMMKQI